MFVCVQQGHISMQELNHVKNVIQFAEFVLEMRPFVCLVHQTKPFRRTPAFVPNINTLAQTERVKIAIVRADHAQVPYQRIVCSAITVLLPTQIIHVLLSHA